MWYANNRHFSMSLDWEDEMKEQADFVSRKVFANDISIRSLLLEEVKGLSWSPLIRELISSTRLPPPLLNHPSKTPPSNTFHLVTEMANLDCQFDRIKKCLGSQCSLRHGVSVMVSPRIPRRALT